ncbi:UNVERIFIED_CONTAM: hypothetical protein GTU68_061948 [Idotea baltica]|nr:hypothetical protein [Idotea baltica]
MRARVLDVTPEEEGSDKPAKDASASEARATEAPATKAPATKAGAKVEVAQAEPAAAPVEEAAAIDPELIKAGAKVFKKCKACHQVGEGAKNRSGPILTGIVDHAAGVVEKYKYSKALKKQAEAGLIWDEANLDAFLTKPKSFMKGTKMSFAGLKKAKDRNAIIAYLRSVSE